MEGAPLGIDDLSRHQAHRERFGASRMGAGHRAIHLHQEVVGDDLVVLQDAFHEPLGPALLEGGPQRPFVVAVAGPLLGRSFGDDHGQPWGLAGTGATTGTTAGLVPKAASSSFSSGSEGTYPDLAMRTLPSGVMATIAGTVHTFPSQTP